MGRGNVRTCDRIMYQEREKLLDIDENKRGEKQIKRLQRMREEKRGERDKGQMNDINEYEGEREKRERWIKWHKKNRNSGEGEQKRSIGKVVEKERGEERKRKRNMKRGREMGKSRKQGGSGVKCRKKKIGRARVLLYLVKDKRIKLLCT